MSQGPVHPYLELTLPADAPFELRPSPGKGWGAFATRDIAPDTKVVNEAPLLRVKGSIQDISLEDIELEATRLSIDQRAQIDLLRVDGNIDEKYPNIGAALNHNLFSATKDDGRGVGLYVLASRFNHSCTPNLINPLNRESTNVKLIAFASIAAGTELTFKYHGFLEAMTRAERHVELRMVCLCALCSAKPEVVYLSDLRRRLIRGLYFLIFGQDIVQYGTRADEKNSMPDLVPDVTRRRAAEEYRLPLASRFVHICLIFALMEAEGVMNPMLYDRLDWILMGCWQMFQDAHNKTLGLKMFDSKKDWCRRFGELSLLYGRTDPADEVGNAVMMGKLVPMLKK